MQALTGEPCAVEPELDSLQKTGEAVCGLDDLILARYLKCMDPCTCSYRHRDGRDNEGVLPIGVFLPRSMSSRRY